ncbi:MAG TPA: Flp pilus assembly protein CpaB [Angustibacter sp.]|nr:Flp pilus assembly protein CpaB [Angustibacter sp.]
MPLPRRRPGLRRWLAAGATAAAVASGLQVLAPEPQPGRAVVVAARDVPAGAALQGADLTVVSRPVGELPASAVSRVADAVGRVVAAPLASREVLTASRLVGDGLLLGQPPSAVAAPVRVADAAAAALLHPGSRVDVLVAVEGARTARTVARGATVLARPDDGAAGPLLAAGDTSSGGLVLLAVDGSTAAALAQSAAAGPLSVVLR